MATLTKVDDLLLTFGPRSSGDRPCVVLDPFGLVPGLPEVVWDPIRGCVDPLVAEQEGEIGRLRKPVAREYELVPTTGGVGR